jgi:hypothetical protein
MLCKNRLTLWRITHFINGFCITEKMILGVFKKNGSIIQWNFVQIKIGNLYELFLFSFYNPSCTIENLKTVGDLNSY